MPEVFHPREAKRIASAQKLRMIGTPAEERFDKITRIAMRMFKVPISIIDIVAETRLWLKSVQGFDSMESIRKFSYCQHAILRDQICYIPDARTDPRTIDSPYNQDFVFYAGVPLVHDGEHVGVFCICDNVPREMTEDEFSSLRELASMAEHELAVTALSESQLALAKQNEELATKALVDPLTRIWNRGAISEILARELEVTRAQGKPTSILVLDLDHFKKINDTYGHPGGDEVLRKVSERLRQTLRPLDAAGRWGGEEFICVLTDCDRTGALAVADRIRLALKEKPILFEDKEIFVTSSIGGVTSTSGDDFVDVLVKEADRCLYYAKQAGRDRVMMPRR